MSRELVGSLLSKLEHFYVTIILPVVGLVYLTHKDELTSDFNSYF